MKIVGSVNLSGGVNRADGNMLFPVIHKGDIFPVAPAAGQLFFRTDLSTVYVYDGAGWSQTGGGDVTNPMTADLDAAGHDINNVGNINATNGTFGTPTTYWTFDTFTIFTETYPLLRATSATTFSNIGAIRDGLVIYAPDAGTQPGILMTDGTTFAGMSINLDATPPYFTVLGPFGINTLGGGFVRALTLDNTFIGGAGNPGDGERVVFRCKHEGGGLGTGFDTAYIDAIMTDETEFNYAGALEFYTCDVGAAPTRKLRLDKDGTKITGNIQTTSLDGFYFGDPFIDGTWRIVRSGNNLQFERRESGGYVTKQTMTP